MNAVYTENRHPIINKVPTLQEPQRHHQQWSSGVETQSQAKTSNIFWPSPALQHIICGETHNQHTINTQHLSTSLTQAEVQRAQARESPWHNSTFAAFGQKGN